jgi:hypothetical protein
VLGDVECLALGGVPRIFGLHKSIYLIHARGCLGTGGVWECLGTFLGNSDEEIGDGGDRGRRR